MAIAYKSLGHNLAAICCLLAVANRGDLVNRNVTFTYDPLCRRQLIVLQEVDQQSACQPLVTPQTSIGGVFDTLARGNTAHHSTVAPTAGLDEAGLDGNQREALLKKLSRQMSRGGTPLSKHATGAICFQGQIEGALHAAALCKSLAIQCMHMASW